MMKPALSSGIVALLLLAASPSGAQIVPEHVRVGCIVAEKYPKITACFTPTSSLARARVYFRASGTPHWYFVVMKSDAPCFAGILPKVKREMVGKTIDYYVEATDKKFAEARTPESAPEVVGSEGECKKDVPVAPFVSKASVVVSAAAGAPAVPIGFAAASAASLTVPIVAAGVAAAAGTTALVATGGNDSTTVTTFGGGGSTTGTTQPPTNPSPSVPTTATTQPAQVKCRIAFGIDPDPPVGTEPLAVTFDNCATTGENLRFSYDFDGDGIVDFRGGQSACRVTRRYSLAGVSSAATTIAPATSTFRATVTGSCLDQGVTESQTFSVQVSQAGFRIKTGDQAPSARRLSWVSQLDIPEARGQVVVNGEAVVYAAAGRSAAAAVGRRGENRLEAQIVQGTGKAGTWRIDLGGTSSLVKGSLRVIAGEVEAVAGDAVVFRLSGKAGERVVLAFKTEK